MTVSLTDDDYPGPSRTELANICAVHRACLLTAENADIRRLVLGMADRIAAQSEALSRAAERKDSPPPTEAAR